jgi:hypothetical protein
VNLFKTRAQALQMKRRFNNKKRRQVMNALPGQHPQTLSPGPLKVALAGARPEPALRWSIEAMPSLHMSSFSSAVEA